MTTIMELTIKRESGHEVILRNYDGWEYRAIVKRVFSPTCRWNNVIWYHCPTEGREGLEVYAGENYGMKDITRSWSRNYGTGPFPKWLVPIVEELKNVHSSVKWDGLTQNI